MRLSYVMPEVTLEEFERRVRGSIYSDHYPSNQVVQENALFGETASYLAVLLLCSHFGISMEAPVDDIPRRARLDQWTPAELAIQEAVDAVEAMGADVRLTDAVVLLAAARDSVADYVDGIECRRSVVTTKG